MFIKDYGNNRVINVDMVCRFSIQEDTWGKYDVELSLADSDILYFKGFDSKLEAEQFINIIIEFNKERYLPSASLDFILATVKAQMEGNKDN